MMEDGVEVFLETLGMSQYYGMFKAKGYDLESDIPHITADELQDVLMISCQQDRATILAKVQSYQPSTTHMVYEWLRGCFLDYYFISFVQSELTDLQSIAQLELPDENLYDELEIVLPGHRKRLERAVQKLKSEQMKTAKAEIPVTIGWWGKPECLPQAKFDFLCVRAFLFSFQDSKNRVAVDFMVDSGSDVSTVQQSILDGLNLDLIGPVYSCGVHGGNHCNLYRACLAVGDEKIEIEVMGSNYNSLGSRVVRHFRHVIDGQRHIWLTGNYQDPLPAILPLRAPQTSSSTEVKALPGPSDDRSQKETNILSSTHGSTHIVSATCESRQVLANLKNIKKTETEDFSAAPKVPEEVKSIDNASHISCMDLSSNIKETGARDSHNVKETPHSLNLNGAQFRTNNMHSPLKLVESNCTQTKDNAKVLDKDEVNNRRMSLSNVIPPNLRDTDDDVDHHERPQCHNNHSVEKNSSFMCDIGKYSSNMIDCPINGEETIVSVLNNSSLSTVNQNWQHCLDLSIETNNSSCDRSKSPPFTSNFVQASSEVVMLSLDDLDIPQDMSADSINHEKRKDTEVFEESLFSPSKRHKQDNSSFI